MKEIYNIERIYKLYDETDLFLEKRHFKNLNCAKRYFLDKYIVSKNWKITDEDNNILYIRNRINKEYIF